MCVLNDYVTYNHSVVHGPLTRYVAGCACAGNAGNVFPRHRFQRKPLVSDPGMHHGTCVTHVPWCMSGSLTCGDGKNVPGIPGACAPGILRIWQEAHWKVSAWLALWNGKSPVDSLHKDTAIPSLGDFVVVIRACYWANTRVAGDMKRHESHVTSWYWMSDWDDYDTYVCDVIPAPKRGRTFDCWSCVQSPALQVLRHFELSRFGMPAGIRNIMMTSSNGNIFRVTGHLCGEIGQTIARLVIWDAIASIMTSS